MLEKKSSMWKCWDKSKNEKLYIQAGFCTAGSILDVGFAANPNPYIQNAIGLDIAIPEAIPKNYVGVVQCNLNIESIPFKDEHFDNVIAGDLIEHLENPSHFLREANRVLKDNGRLVICTPHANDWWVTLHNWFFRGVVNDPDAGEHLQNWTILDMKRLLKKSGFRLIAMEGYYMHFPKINLAIKVRRFPVLSWQIFYVACKYANPDTTVLTRIDKKWIRVE